MNSRIVLRILKDSESKKINIFFGGKLAIQYNNVAIEVSDEGNGTIAAKEVKNGVVAYIDCLQVSSIVVEDGSKPKEEDNPFID